MASPESDRRREKRQTDPEFAARERETARRWRQRNPAKRAEYHARWYQAHRTDVLAAQKAYYAEHRDDYRAKTAARIYGITVEDFREMVERQAGLCAICGRPEMAVIAGKSQTLSIDHDHETGRVRALLCSNCNTALGLFGDDSSRLRLAATYLETYA